MPLGTGHRLGRYEVLSLIGAGGMGEVYLAHDTKLERKVAIKVLLGSATTSDDRLRRFAQEARAASALNHPNIVTVHDVDVEDGTRYITTEFVDGETLRARLRRGRLPLIDAVRIASQVADALAAAHREGIVHRDIKPENVLLRPDGYVKVVDFGLAKLSEPAGDSDETQAATRVAHDTDAGVVLGTVAYMSPEQARGLRVDQRTDVWSLGVVLYEMVTGRRPFEGPTSSDIIAMILHKEPPKVAPLVPEATGDLELVLETALAKDVDERYQTARDFLNTLKRVRRHLEADSESRRALPSDPAGASAVLPTPPPSSSPMLTPAPDSANELQRRDHQPGAATAQDDGSGRRRRTRRRDCRRRLRRLPAAGAEQRAAAVRALQDHAPDHERTRPRCDGLPRRAVRGAQRGGRHGAEPLGAAGQDRQQRQHRADRAGDLPWAGVLARRGLRLLRRPRSAESHGESVPDSRPGRHATARARRHRHEPHVFAGWHSTGLHTRYPKEHSTSVVVANIDGSGERRLATVISPDFFPIDPNERTGPAWSPDGRSIAAPKWNSTGVVVAVVDVADGSIRKLATKTWYNLRRVGWLADSSAILAAAAENSASYLQHQVWAIPVSGAAPRKITNDLNDYAGMSTTTAGGAFVAVQLSGSAAVWVAPGGDALRATAITSGGPPLDGAGVSHGRRTAG